jgi:RNA polymerase sporulation-specific sigma factor
MALSQDLSDEALQALSVSGSSEAEELLIRRYTRVVRALCRPYSLAGMDSEDLIQEGMLGLLSALRSYAPDGGASFKTFAKICIRRCLISSVRRSAAKKNVSLDDCISLETALFDENQSPKAYGLRDDSLRRPEELVIGKEESQKLFRNVFAMLTKNEQQVLHLYLSGMSYREIAEVTKKTEKAVDNTIQRIKQKVARLLQRSNGDYSLG